MGTEAGFDCLGLHRRPPEVVGTSGSLARDGFDAATFLCYYADSECMQSVKLLQLPLEGKLSPQATEEVLQFLVYITP